MSLSPPQNSQSIAVVGLGGIGAVAAACLQEAGCHRVVGCSRKPIDRLFLEGPEGTKAVPLRSLTDPADADGVDWVLLCTKAHQTASTAPWLARLCRPSTRVAVLQNGICHKDRVGRFVGGATIVPTVVYFNAERLAFDHVRLRQFVDHDFAVADDAEGHAFARLFNGTQLHVLLSSDLKTLMWRKLLINAVANPITALTMQRMSVLRRGDVAALGAAILDEVVAVARASGAKLVSNDVSTAIRTIGALPPDTGTSMYFDRLEGRELEFEAITGAIVSVGERLGVPTPLNRALATLLRATSEAGAKA